MYPIIFRASTSWADALKSLNTATRCKIYDAVFAYAAGEALPKMDAVEAAVFGFIKIDMDIDKEKHLRMNARNRENGKKGGAPKGNQNASKKF